MESRNKKMILVLDGDMISALTILRSLSRLGYFVELASSEQRPVAFHSRYAKRTSHYPDPLLKSAEFVEWLSEAADSCRYQLIIPVTERSLLPIKHAFGRFSDSLIAMPSVESLDPVLDKAQTFSLARSLSIPVPKGEEISVETVLDNLKWQDYPVVIKPAASLASSGKSNKQLNVDYAFDRKELVSKVSQCLGYGRVILQQYVQGDGVGVEVLACRGEVIFAFQHQRLHEVPLTGGGSSLRQSVPLDERLLKASKALVRELGWHGVAMVEFKVDGDSGEFYLMEINGRFWGSLPLAAAAGADFPGMLVQMLLEGKVDFPQEYHEGILCRRLTSDVHWYELALRKAAPDQLGVIPSKRRMLADFLLMFTPRHRFDVQSLSDPLPGLIEFARLVQDYWRRLAGVLVAKWYYRRQLSFWRRGNVRSAVCGAKNILFLCYGNINRSAIAELLAQKTGLADQLRVSSAGFHDQAGRSLDPVMRDLAFNTRVDAEGFTSTCVSFEMIEQADVIFVMEKCHHEVLSERYPGNNKKIYLLGGASPDAADGIVLPDPYGMPREIYQRTFTRIERSINVLTSWVSR